MKLFIWSDPYRVPYGHSMVFAVAETVDDARRIVKDAQGYSYGHIPKCKGFDIELGEPTRVVDIPCAEWHEWEE